MKVILIKKLYLFTALVILFGVDNSASALLMGFIFSFLFKNPFKFYIPKAIHYFLKISVIGLGFSMLIKETIETSKESFSLIFYAIILTVSLGLLLSRLLKMDLKLGHLITSGTSICGGSAIAAIAPVIKANGKSISIALGIIFLLNSIALLIFPKIGQLLNLSQKEFGLWCAIAIHDTSSVVGATIGYGQEALRIGTTVKLLRTLWIIPLTVFSMFLFKTKGEKIKFPYFILLFLLAIFINSSHILPTSATSLIVLYSKRLLILTLFLVGSTFSITDLKSTGLPPILLAISLWLFISIFSLIYITY